MKKVAIVQSNYIPWKGYFDMINLVDEFILYDDMQYTKRDWRNRNKISTPQGLKWLTIPVDVKGKYFQAIKDTQISDRSWSENHWRTIQHNYSKAAYFKDYSELFKQLYLGSEESYLSKINYNFIVEINKLLGIETCISWSSDYKIMGEKTEKLLHICKQSGATEYISGPAAKVYLDEALFKQENIAVNWMDYDDYKPYQQLNTPFEHGVTILDLIFNEGPSAKAYLKTFSP